MLRRTMKLNTPGLVSVVWGIPWIDMVPNVPDCQQVLLRTTSPLFDVR